MSNSNAMTLECSGESDERLDTFKNTVTTVKRRLICATNRGGDNITQRTCHNPS